MMIDIPNAAAKEEKLLQVTNALELLKDVVESIVEEMEEWILGGCQTPKALLTERLYKAMPVALHPYLI